MRLFAKSARTRLLIGVAAGALVMSAGSALAQERDPISIAPQSLATALHEFGSQTSRQVMYTPGLIASKESAGVSAATNEQQALAQLLAGTGLSYRREGDIYMIVQAGEGGRSPQDQGAAGGGAEVEALIVTAQKKEEAIQDVPIAISAFTQKSLDAQKIEGGFDLLKAIPNVTFSKSNFTGYNFSIRGIGTKAVSATTDPGVAVAFNNTTLIVNRLFEQEYFDVERVEVLRGPQGTLYGRNATSGVINVISAKPRLMDFEGDIKLETGNYGARRARGMVNIPIGDTLAIRLAGAMTKRDGYGVNQAADDPVVINDVAPDVDNRDLWSARLTVGWEPVEQLRFNVLWERFEEDDQRVRTSKQLCHHDAGPDMVGSLNTDDELNQIGRASLSQGCLPGSLYEHGAFGTPNGASLPYVGGLYWAPLFGNIASGGSIVGFGGSPYTPSTAPCAAVGGGFLYPIDLCRPDPYDGRRQSEDLRTIHSQIEPIYRAKADIFDLTVDFDINDSLTLTSQTVYSRDEVYATQDYNRYATFPIFTDSSTACNWIPGAGFGGGSPDCSSVGTYASNPGSAPFPHLAGPLPGYYANLTPGGVFTDPQLGPSRSLVAQDLSKASSDQFNQELRLASNFDHPLNFSLGANFTRFETYNDYYVFINGLTLLTNFFPFMAHTSAIQSARCFGGWEANQDNPNASGCFYVDRNPLASIDGEGHNYFRSANPYELTSSAVFGELYWQATETLKVTLGARMTWDRKVFTPVPSQLLLHDYRDEVGAGEGYEACVSIVTTPRCKIAGSAVGGRGSPPNPDIVQEWREPTGRIIVDWKPDLSFTDETMVYASIAHGYKGGGANPPTIAPPAGLINALASQFTAPPTFDPEFINAFEVGTKNTLLGGGLVLNGTLFYYDYEGYQVSKIVDRSAFNENFDSKVWGAELEWIFSPTRNLRFNGSVGYLQTEIAEGEQSIDLMDRTQQYTTGGPTTFMGEDGVERTGWLLLKPWITNSSNCIVHVDAAEAALAANVFLMELCPGGGVWGGDHSGVSGLSTPIPNYGFWNPYTMAPNNGAGFWADLGGHELPNAPHWTMSLGAQYRFALPAGWDGTVRADYYWQDESYARVYNTEYDRLRSWTNTNFSLWVENPDWGVTAEVYVKNVFNETPITDTFLNSDDSGLTTNVFTLDPRLIGVSVRKQF